MLLDKLLPKLRAEAHCVLIFSQFTMMLDLLADFLKERRLTSPSPAPSPSPSP